MFRGTAMGTTGVLTSSVDISLVSVFVSVFVSVSSVEALIVALT